MVWLMTLVRVEIILTNIAWKVDGITVVESVGQAKFQLEKPHYIMCIVYFPQIFCLPDEH